MEHADYVRHIHRLCPDLTITQTEGIGDGFTSTVLVVNNERVFRFINDPKYAWVAEGWAEDAEILRLLRDYVSIPVPLYDLVDAGCVSYRMLPGRGLDRASLLRLPERDQDVLAASLAGFLCDLRSIPADVLQEHGIGRAWITRSVAEYQADYERLEREVFPHANRLVRRMIREHFEPVLNGRLDLSYEPGLVHGDLKPWHILATMDPPRISGVIDWDGTGVDDPAQDLGAILYSYGESFVRRMAMVTPELAPIGIGSMIDRARFYAGRIEPLWIAAGIADQDPRWLAATLGLARDINPTGTKLS